MLMVVNDDDTDAATDLASNQADDDDGRWSMMDDGGLAYAQPSPAYFLSIQVTILPACHTDAELILLSAACQRLSSS